MPVSCSVFLNATNVEKSVEFYEALGFRVRKTYPDDEGRLWWADLDLQGAELGLGAIQANDDPDFRAWVSTPLGAGVVVYFTVPDADRYYDRAVQAGLVIEQPITDRPYGRLFTVNDPDGYTVTFLTEPKPRAPRKKAAKGRAGAKKAAGKRTKKRATKKRRTRA